MSNVKNKDGSLKKKYHDKPRYNVIFGYEKSFTNNFNSTSKKMSKEIVSEIVKMSGIKK